MQNQNALVTIAKKMARPFLSENVKRLLWQYEDILRYALPDIRKPSVPMSARTKDWLKTLRKDGIVKMEAAEFTQLANYLDDHYFKKIESRALNHNLTGEELGNPELFLVDNSDERVRRGGNLIRAAISVKDPMINSLFLLNPDVTSLLYNYYRRQPYYRGQPEIEKVNPYKGDGAATPEYHVDHLHQITCMLLISDQTEQDTHMEYVLGTHRRSMAKGIYLTTDEATKIAKEGRLYSCVGKKGTLFICDASGVHRRKLTEGGIPRKDFHCVLTTGHNMYRFKDDLENWPKLREYPKYVQKMLQYKGSNYNTPYY